MKYLITALPVLHAHGTYQYDKITQEQATAWLQEHHKQLQPRPISFGPQQSTGVPDVRILAFLAEHIDHFIKPSDNVPLSSLQPDDEVLVVHRVNPTPQSPNTPVKHIGELNFAFFQHQHEHHAEHQHHEELAESTI